MASALSMRDGGHPVVEARIDWYVMGALQKLKVHAASVGPFRGPAGDWASEPDQVRAAYQAAVVALLRHDPRPLILRFSVADHGDRDIDALWRIGIGLEAVCTIADQDSLTVVQLQFPGAKAALAAFFSTFPGHAFAGSARTLLHVIRGGGLFSRRRRDRHFVVLGLDTSQPSHPVRAPNGLRFEEVSVEEVERRPARYGVSPLGGVAPKGGRCFAGLLNGELVYRMWVRFDDATVYDALPDDVRPRVERPAVLISGCHTAIAHRGRSIYPAALSWVADLARQNGARQLLMFVNVENASSLRAAANAGFTKIMDTVLGGTAQEGTNVQ